MIDRAARNIVAAALLLAAALVLASCWAAEGAEPPTIGEAPAIADHTDQKAISSGDMSIDEIIRRGELLFEAPFNTLDGAGRPETADVERRNNVSIGNPRPRHEFPDNFNRISAPDANTCLECHTVPRAGRRRRQRRKRLRAGRPAALRDVRRRAQATTTRPTPS